MVTARRFRCFRSPDPRAVERSASRGQRHTVGTSPRSRDGSGPQRAIVTRSPLVASTMARLSSGRESRAVRRTRAQDIAPGLTADATYVTRTELGVSDACNDPPHITSMASRRPSATTTDPMGSGPSHRPPAGGVHDDVALGRARTPAAPVPLAQPPRANATQTNTTPRRAITSDETSRHPHNVPARLPTEPC
jgi:hypothetical protein